MSPRFVQISIRLAFMLFLTSSANASLLNDDSISYKNPVTDLTVLFDPTVGFVDSEFAITIGPSQISAVAQR